MSAYAWVTLGNHRDQRWVGWSGAEPPARALAALQQLRDLHSDHGVGRTMAAVIGGQDRRRRSVPLRRRVVLVGAGLDAGSGRGGSRRRRSQDELLDGRRPPVASEPTRVERATSWLDHGADHESVEAVGQQISEASESERAELLAWVGRRQDSRSLRSATSASREFVGAAHEEGSGRQERGAGHDAIDVVVAAQLSHRSCGVARVGVLGRRR